MLYVLWYIKRMYNVFGTHIKKLNLKKRHKTGYIFDNSPNKNKNQKNKIKNITKKLFKKIKSHIQPLIKEVSKLQF